MSWYSTGYEAVDAEKERQARAGGPTRYWMKAGTTREIVLIDDEPVSIYEHNWRMNGRWDNNVTCLKGISDIVPCCEKLGDRSRSFIGFYTIVDCTLTESAKGAKYQYELKLLPAKLKTLNLLRRKKTDKGSLVGAMFKVTRDSSDDLNVGNDYDYMREADLDALFKVANYKGKKLPELYKEAAEKPEVLERMKYTFQAATDSNGKLLPKIFPFNYMNLLAPKEPKEVRALVSGYVPEEAEGATRASPKDDDIPF